jgi:hypothetical protein
MSKKKPEHVLCSNCAFWAGFALDERGFCVGLCRRHPPSVKVDEGPAYRPLWQPPVIPAHSWCGEFRSEWPAEAR